MDEKRLHVVCSDKNDQNQESSKCCLLQKMKWNHLSRYRYVLRKDGKHDGYESGWMERRGRPNSLHNPSILDKKGVINVVTSDKEKENVLRRPQVE